jgi:hypothetical protein
MYTCYSCGDKVDHEALRYICKCEERMGVCKSCENTPIIEWKNEIPCDHNLEKLHDLSDAQLRLNEQIAQTCGTTYSSYSVGRNADCRQTLTIYYFEGPNGEKDKTFAKFVIEKYGYSIEYCDPDIRSQYRKEATFILSEQFCKCCQRVA